MLIYFYSFMVLVGCTHLSERQMNAPVNERPVSDTSNQALEDVLQEQYLVSELKKQQDRPPEKMNTEQKVDSSTKKIALEKKKEIVKAEEVPLAWQLFDQSWIREGEYFLLNVNYMGLPAASFAMEVKPSVMMNGKEVFHFHARAKSAKYYKWIYHLDDIVESFVDKEFFVPFKYKLIQREKKKDSDRIEIYDREKKMTYYRYVQVKNKVESKDKQDAEIPFYSQDLFSSYFFMKGLPLHDGDHYQFPVTSKAKTWILSLKVEGRETLKHSLGEFQAIRLKVETHYEGNLAKKGTFLYWLSDDAKRMFLQFTAEVKIGSIKGSLAQYRLGDFQLTEKK